MQCKAAKQTQFGVIAIGRQLVLAALGTAVVAGAQAQAITATAPPCDPASCTLQNFGTVRADTESLYGDVLTALSAHERPALRENQGVWRRSARQHCQYNAPVSADPAAPEASRHHFCMIEQDMQRRLQLRKWLMSGYAVD